VNQFSYFSVFSSENKSAEEAEIKTTTFFKSFDILCCCTTLRNIDGQLLYSFAAQLIQFKVMQRRLITINIHEDADAIYLFVYTDCFTTSVKKVCLRHVFVLEWCTPLVNAKASEGSCSSMVSGIASVLRYMYSLACIKS